MTQQIHTIAESNNFIVLDKYSKVQDAGDSYQSESDLERELIQDLLNQGYEFISVKSRTAMLANVRDQLQHLNGVVFNESEWRRFAEQYLDSPSDSSLDKTRKIHIDYICDFTFDDGRLENIYLIDKKNLLRNKVQVIQQFEQTGYTLTVMTSPFWLTACRWCKSNSKSVAWRFVKPLTRYTVTARKALTTTTPCLNTCNSS